MVVLAFLQNMWVKDPEKVQQSLDRHLDNPMFWNRMTKGLLFSGCKTGRVLIQTFGTDLIENIIFDECTKEICNNPKTIPTPDLIHIETTLLRLKPDIIITFGKIAFNTINNFTPELQARTILNYRIIEAPHPAARQPITINKLREVAEKLKAIMALEELKQKSKGIMKTKKPRRRYLKTIEEIREKFAWRYSGKVLEAIAKMYYYRGIKLLR